MEEKERRERLKNLKTQIDMAGIYTCITCIYMYCI